MDGTGPGTSGGPRGTNGNRYFVLLGVVAALLVYAALQLWANVGSKLTDSEGSADPRTVWTLELSSFAAWCIVVLLLWRAIPHMLPPRRSLPVAAVLLVVGAPIASAVHVGLMVGLREIAWAFAGGDYHFPEGMRGFPYELRKDIADYALLAAIAAALHWYMLRPSPAAGHGASAERILEISDGSRRIRVPLASIDRIEAAANYVEIHAQGKTYLYRATMAAVEAELGPAFVRIHRSRLVRRDAVRAIESGQSGDFTVTLANGERVRGSRRYRDALA
jgi:hypothetical protein